MAEKAFRHYKVIETKDKSAGDIQFILDRATNGFPEMQIDHTIGTKIILGYDSILSEKGRAEARFADQMKAMTNTSAVMRGASQ